MNRSGADFRAHATGRRRLWRVFTALAICMVTVASFYALSDGRFHTNYPSTDTKSINFEHYEDRSSLRGVAASAVMATASTTDRLHTNPDHFFTHGGPIDTQPLDSSSATTLQSSNERRATGTSPKVMAIVSRYDDDIEWLTASKAGLVTDNTTNPPSTLLPIIVYQATDLAEDESANPAFPGPVSGSESKSSGALVTSESLEWPEWALSWVHRKNKTHLESKPGSAEDAEREQRLKLGLDPIEVSHQEAKMKKKDDDTTGDGGDKISKRVKRTHRGKEQVLAAGMTDGANSTETKSSIVLCPSISHLRLHLVPNRGAEAMGYLTGIIEQYDTLPDFVAFMHGHRHSWHMMLPQDWQLRRLATSPPRNLSATYLPLGCHERGMMERGKIYPTNIDANYESPNGPRWHEALAARFAQAWREYLGKALGIEEIPDFVKIPSGASFIVSKEAIHRRPKEWYIDLREWLMQTLIESKWLGIVLEFSWGFIFSNNAVIEISQEECLCQVYNM